MIGPFGPTPPPPPPAQPNRAPSQERAPSHDTPKPFLDFLGQVAPASTPTVPTVPTPQPNVAPVASVPPGSASVAPTPTITPATLTSEMAGLALRIEHRAGAVELIASPWRLMATGGLARVFGLRTQADPAARSGNAALQRAGVLLARGNAVLGQGEAVAPAVSGIEATGGFAAGTGIPVERFDVADAANVRVRPGAPAALPWVARLLRWLDDHGEATLWVRDFRLDEADKRALVATLRTAAAQSGFRLDRIVINGRAHWHVHRPTRETAHAG